MEKECGGGSVVCHSLVGGFPRRIPAHVQVYSGLLMSRPAQFKTPQSFLRLVVHEFQRVYGDRMIIQDEGDDTKRFQEILTELVKRNLSDMEGVNVDDLLSSTNIACFFSQGIGGDKYYDFVPNMTRLKQVRPPLADLQPG